jgi:hypothetical protein
MSGLAAPRADRHRVLDELRQPAVVYGIKEPKGVHTEDPVHLPRPPSGFEASRVRRRLLEFAELRWFDPARPFSPVTIGLRLRRILLREQLLVQFSLRLLTERRSKSSTSDPGCPAPNDFFRIV